MRGWEEETFSDEEYTFYTQFSFVFLLLSLTSISVLSLSPQPTTFWTSTLHTLPIHDLSCPNAGIHRPPLRTLQVTVPLPPSIVHTRCRELTHTPKKPAVSKLHSPPPDPASQERAPFLCKPLSRAELCRQEDVFVIRLNEAELPAPVFPTVIAGDRF